MALEVIGAGFGRTGTDSLRQALERLGFAPCHHMFVIREDVPGRIGPWEAHARGEPQDWRAVFEGWRAQVDWPGAAVWRELAETFPEAKVILSVRDPEAWWRSVEATILPFILQKLDPETPDMARQMLMTRHLIDEGVFGGRMAEKDHAVAVYEAHVADVKASLPPERLLVYETGSGWEPICGFLGLPVPEEPYPHSNSTAEFRARIGRAE